MTNDDSAENSWRLVGLNDELCGKRFALRHGLSLGRAVHADVFLPDPDVARHHCRIEVARNRIELSTAHPNGSFALNGRLVRSTVLKSHDIVTVGRFRLRVERSESPGPDGREDPKRARQACSSITEAATGQSGLVLVGRLVAGPARSGFPEFAHRLRERLRHLVTTNAATLNAADPTCWRICWLDSEQGIEKLRASAGRIACSVHRIAYSTGGSRVAIGLARGRVNVADVGQSDPLIWGPAVDRGLRLATLAAPCSTLLDPNGEVADAPSRTEVARHSGAPLLVRGFRADGDGRREKLSTATPASLRCGHGVVDAFVVRVTYDPQTSLATINLLCSAPLDSGSSYVLTIAPLSGLQLRCGACEPIENSEAFRARLTGTWPREGLISLFGFDPFRRESLCAELMFSESTSTPSIAA